MRGENQEHRGTPVRPPRERSERRDARALIDAVFPAEADGAAAGRSLIPDLQSLLSAAVRQLAEATHAERVCAWTAEVGGRIQTPAAQMQSGHVPLAPDSGTFAALRRLERATDLGASGQSTTLRELAMLEGFSAAIAVAHDEGGLEGGAVSVLAIGGGADRPGEVRPRTLARLEEIASGLRGPLAAHTTLARLGDLDESVRRLDRLAALGDLVSEVVHEVRNPLVSVKTFLQLLPDRIDDPEFVDDFRGVVCDEVARLERLIDSVLVHARSGGPSVADATGSVEEAFATIVQLVDHRAHERQIELTQSVESAGARVTLNGDRLRQLLLNLVMNALDVTPPGGHVILRAERCEDAAQLCITVEDQGPGVAAAERERIFEAFYSLRGDRPGGLGLAISRRLVEEAGGEIEVGDAPGRGARFSVRLPVAVAAEPALARESEPPRG